jgi:hypothetical protein
MRRYLGIRLVLAGLLLCPAAAGAGVEEPEFTTDFELDDCTLSDTGENPYFILQPGHQLVLEGEDDGEALRLQITVLNQKKWIKLDLDPDDGDGRLKWVKTRVIEEREWKDGELVEVSRNFFARCKQTGDVYYFGEDVDIYEDGEIVSHDGAWLAGADGARPGLFMPGTFLLGSRYFQEIAPGVAEDRAEHVAMGLELDLPAGVLDDCVRVVETSPLEPGSESEKFYCEGVGLVADDEAVLVSYPDDGEDDD